MDCRTTQQHLELGAAWQEACDASLRDEVSTHLEECRGCSEVVEARSKFDRRIAGAMVDVPIPEGLLDRILSNLPVPTVDEASNLEAAPSGEREPHNEAPAAQVGHEHDAASPPVSRRSMLRRFSVISACAVAALAAGWMLLPSQPTTLTLNQLQKAALELRDQPNGFHGGLAQVPESEMVPVDLIWRRHAGETQWRLPLAEAPGIQATVQSFSLQAGRRRTQGYFLIVSQDHLSDPPSTEPTGHYSPAMVSWTQGDQTYVCVITQGRMEDVIEFLQGVPA